MVVDVKVLKIVDKFIDVFLKNFKLRIIDIEYERVKQFSNNLITSITKSLS